VRRHDASSGPKRWSALAVGALLASLGTSCGPAREPIQELEAEAYATGFVRHEIDGILEEWEVGRDGEGLPCYFRYYVLLDGFVDLYCDDIFYFTAEVPLTVFDADSTLLSPSTAVGDGGAPMTAALTITESIGTIDFATDSISPDYLRRFDLAGTLDCESDAELDCEGVWSFEVEGEQTRADVRFVPTG